eukprot:GSA120T00014208001.1
MPQCLHVHCKYNRMFLSPVALVLLRTTTRDFMISVFLTFLVLGAVFSSSSNAERISDWIDVHNLPGTRDGILLREAIRHADTEDKENAVRTASQTSTASQVVLTRRSLPRSPRIVAALTTTPKRLHLLKPCLDSLLHKQTVPLDAVYLFVPWVFLRNNEEYDFEKTKDGKTSFWNNDDGGYRFSIFPVAGTTTTRIDRKYKNREAEVDTRGGPDFDLLNELQQDQSSRALHDRN